MNNITAKQKEIPDGVPSAAMPFLLLFLFMSILFFPGFIIFVIMLIFFRFLLFKPREQESRQVRQIIQTEKQKPDISARF